MTKRVKYTEIWKEWKLIYPHLLRPWSTCKIWFEISYADFVSSAVWHKHCDHPSNLRFESDAFCASGLVVMGFLVWEERSGKQDLRVVVGWGFLFQACVNSGVTLKGLRGVDNAAVVAFEESCVLDVKSETPLVISSGRVQARYLFCNWKYRLAFSSSRRSFRESTSSMLPFVSCIAGRSGTGERFCCFRYFRISWGIFFLKPCLVKGFLTGQDVCSQSTIIRGTQREYGSKPLKHSIVEHIFSI